jgi:hypothetical protein
MAGMPYKVARAVASLDAIGGGDPETAHAEADEILLDVAPPDVADAYQRLRDRAEWWACA